MPTSNNHTYCTSRQLHKSKLTDCEKKNANDFLARPFRAVIIHAPHTRNIPHAARTYGSGLKALKPMLLEKRQER
jgi:hypothetical protein